MQFEDLKFGGVTLNLSLTETLPFRVDRDIKTQHLLLHCTFRQLKSGLSIVKEHFVFVFTEEDGPTTNLA